MRQSTHWLWAVVLGVASVAGPGAALLGCHVNESDVKRWATTEHGPDKLVAVMTHDKYDWQLRDEAALELIQMKPRSGRRVGINRLVEALAQMTPDDRKKIVSDIRPAIVAELKQAPPAAAAGQAAPADPSYAYKDATMAMLTYDRAVLVSDDTDRKELTDGLVYWSSHDFDRRLDNTTQMFGMEQLMRTIGASAVKGLPPLITLDSSKYDRIASLVSEIGDQPTKEATAAKLVELAKYTNSQAWIDKQKAGVEEANKASKISATADQLNRQLAQYQDESLNKVFAALKKVGTRPAVDYCLAIAADKTQNEKRRQAALAALEGRVDRSNPGDIEKVLAIASADDTPDSVRDLAFQRIGEMPRDQVVNKLYSMFGSRKWKVRWVAATTVLKMSSTDQLPEFMAKLPVAGLALSEPLTYGGAIDKMTVTKGPKPRDAVMPFLKEGSVSARLAALGYFYAAGKASDAAMLNQFDSDRTLIPKTDDPEGKWQCDVSKADGKESETKDVSSLGDFVRFCVLPAVKTR
ncbi:MAG TPA: hypothetical protein VGL13_00830 [Polyangiaceae bacterium]|jgi:hypothetical protein